MEHYFNLLQEAKQGIINKLQSPGNLTPTSQTMARQCFDHLDAAALFLQQLDHYLGTVQKAAEETAEKAVAAGNAESMEFPKQEE